MIEIFPFFVEGIIFLLVVSVSIASDPVRQKVIILPQVIYRKSEPNSYYYIYWEMKGKTAEARHYHC